MGAVREARGDMRPSLSTLLHASDGPAQQQDLAMCPDSTGTCVRWKTSI